MSIKINAIIWVRWQCPECGEYNWRYYIEAGDLADVCEHCGCDVIVDIELGDEVNK